MAGKATGETGADRKRHNDPSPERVAKAAEFARLTEAQQWRRVWDTPGSPQCGELETRLRKMRNKDEVWFFKQLVELEAKERQQAAARVEQPAAPGIASSAPAEPTPGAAVAPDPKTPELLRLIDKMLDDFHAGGKP